MRHSSTVPIASVQDIAGEIHKSGILKRRISSHIDVRTVEETKQPARHLCIGIVHEQKAMAGFWFCRGIGKSGIKKHANAEPEVFTK